MSEKDRKEKKSRTCYVKCAYMLSPLNNKYPKGKHKQAHRKKKRRNENKSEAKKTYMGAEKGEGLYAA